MEAERPAGARMPEDSAAQGYHPENERYTQMAAYEDGGEKWWLELPGPGAMLGEPEAGPAIGKESN